MAPQDAGVGGIPNSPIEDSASFADASLTCEGKGDYLAGLASSVTESDHTGWSTNKFLTG